jgi:hypothetical protein
MLDLLYDHDWEILELSLRVIVRDVPQPHPLSFCEVGCADGGTTAKALRLLDAECRLPWAYFAVDCEALGYRPTITHKHFTYVSGYSFAPDTLAQLPGDLIWVFIDACHCAACVTRDAHAYIPRVRSGGIIAFHDASPRMQGQDPQSYERLRSLHDHDVAIQHGVQVRQALDQLNRDHLRIDVLLPALDQERGGVELYRKR